MAAFYNEVDPYAAQWLRNLIAAGHIAPGVVDERSVEDIQPDELHAFTQCHFFAGIGVWSHALRLVGWPDDMPVWTGSCPCQPFSSAGKGAGFADERHLWPAFHHLIKERRPAVVFGEQVASSDAGSWIDLVQDDMEALDYAFGAVPFPAAGVGAPHIRDRLYWVADADQRPGGQRGSDLRGRLDGGDAQSRAGSSGGGMSCVLADANGGNTGAERQQRGGEYGLLAQGSGVIQLGDTERDRLRVGRRTTADVADQPGDRPVRGIWAGADWIACRDGKWRPVEPGTFPLAHGATARVGRLRAYGNAIVAPQAAEFIRAYQFAQLA